MKKKTTKKALAVKVVLTAFAVITAAIFLTPIVLTITNSFMSASEISSNYGVIFLNAANETNS